MGVKTAQAEITCRKERSHALSLAAACLNPYMNKMEVFSILKCRNAKPFLFLYPDLLEILELKHDLKIKSTQDVRQLTLVKVSNNVNTENEAIPWRLLLFHYPIVLKLRNHTSAQNNHMNPAIYSLKALQDNGNLSA